MAAPTPAAIVAIRGRVSDWSLSDEAIRDALNGQQAANPVAQPQAPKPMTTTGLMSKVGPAGRGKLYGRPAITKLVEDIRSGNREAVLNWIEMATEAGDLSLTERTALRAEVQALIPDPSWQPAVPAPLIWLGRLVDADDIAATREAVSRG